MSKLTAAQESDLQGVVAHLSKYLSDCLLSGVSPLLLATELQRQAWILTMHEMRDRNLAFVLASRTIAYQWENASGHHQTGLRAEDPEA